jgi:hypothetical protein
VNAIHVGTLSIAVSVLFPEGGLVRSDILVHPCFSASIWLAGVSRLAITPGRCPTELCSLGFRRLPLVGGVGPLGLLHCKPCACDLWVRLKTVKQSHSGRVCLGAPWADMSGRQSHVDPWFRELLASYLDVKLAKPSPMA